jgi:hypothetical protein
MQAMVLSTNRNVEEIRTMLDKVISKKNGKEPMMKTGQSSAQPPLGVDIDLERYDMEKGIGTEREIHKPYITSSEETFHINGEEYN